MLIAVIDEIDTRLGGVVLCEVVNPFEGQLDWARAFAGVVVAESVDPVQIVLTVKDPDAPNTEPPAGAIGEWDGQQRMADLLYRDTRFWRPGHGDRPAVAFGKALYKRGLFTHHSSHRSDQGDAWAHAVGGVAPERTGIPPSLAVAGPAALATLNVGDWWIALLKGR